MKRDIIKIDEELCNGCGDCVPNCHEGALQIIDGKAKLISEVKCDGLGACIGHCPMGAITIIESEAEPFALENKHAESTCGCPGSTSVSLEPSTNEIEISNMNEMPSELRQWPIQMHLINPLNAYFKDADVLLSADCVAYTVGSFHPKYLKGKKLIIACPKLDSNTEQYIEKIRKLISEAHINTLTVMMMEVPCCQGLLQMVQSAVSASDRKVPVKAVIFSLQGKVLKEEWV